MRISGYGRKSFCLFLSVYLGVGLAFFTPLPALADSDVMNRLNACEQAVFGKTNKFQSLSKRIDAIEKVVFGKNMDWSAPEALDQIESVLSGGNRKIQPESKPLEVEVEDDEPGLDIDALFDKAMEAHERGDDKKAEALFRKVLEIEPTMVDALFSLATILENHHDYEASLALIKRVLRIDPNDQEAKTALASIQAKLRQVTGGEQASGKSDWVEDGVQSFYLDGKKPSAPVSQPPTVSRQKGTTSNDALANAAEKFKSGNYREVIQDLSQHIAQNPYDHMARFAISKAYTKVNELDNAISNLKVAIALDPTNARYKSALDNLEIEGLQKKVPDQAVIGKKPGGIVPMAPEPGETVYNFSHSGVGKVLRYAIAGAAIGMATNSYPRGSVGRGALQGGLMGLAIGLLGW